MSCNYSFAHAIITFAYSPTQTAFRSQYETVEIIMILKERKHLQADNSKHAHTAKKINHLKCNNIQ